MEHIDENILIHKWLVGDLDPTEQELFDSLNLSEQERNRLRTMWEQTLEYQTPVAVDTNSAWKAIDQAISVKDNPAKGAKVLPLAPLVRSVAAVALILIVALFVWRHFSFSPTNYIARTDNESIRLADGSTVWLAKGAQLEYPEAFRGKTRRVKLKGKAFFDIQKADKSFVVETENAEVKVLGTEFSLQTDTDGTELVVAEGLVALRSKRSGQSVKVSPKQQAKYSVREGRIVINELDSFNKLAWHTGEVSFKDTPLSEVLSTLSEQFGLEFSLKEKHLQSCMFTSVLKQGDPEKLLKVLSKTFGFSIQKNKDKYLLVGGNCH